MVKKMPQQVDAELPGIVDVTKLVDEQRIAAFTIRLVILSFIIMLADGYDLLAAAYAGPGIVAAWHIRPADLGPVFSASPLGMVLGAPLLGWVGDRFGRRQTVLLGALIFGAFTLASAAATSVEQLMVLRLITGIGLGGMLPNTTALTAEFAPRRMRATLVVLMFMGVTVGGMLPSFVTALAPGSRWQSLFIVGGVASLAMFAVLVVLLPESIKFLALQDGLKLRIRLERTVRALRPDLVVPAGATFVTQEKRRRHVAIAELFSGGLQWITPLVWLLFVINLMVNYFLYSWMPIVFRGEGFSATQGALVTASYYVGGVLGGITISRLIDKGGLIPVTIFFALAGPCIACIGLSGLTQWMVAFFVFMGGFCVLGVQLGINAVVGLIYTTDIRANGVGWAQGIGRLGAMAGPMFGAWLIAKQLPVSRLFLSPSIPMATGAVICFVLMLLCRKRFGGNQLNDSAAKI